MSCANPWKLFDKRTQEFIGYVPCGRCVNCLVDSRNCYEDLCNEELYQRNYCASYLTVTYDDYHLDWRNDWHGHLIPSIKKSDATNFIKRIRSYMDYHNINNPLLNRDFRYIVAAEYGGETHRPHLHFVFFGLDYRVADKMFRQCWQYGQQKLLPVKNGCFRYVINYMFKQVKTIANPRKCYNSYNRERPFFHHSARLGRTLFQRQLDFIKTHDWQYKSRKGVIRPLPSYIRRRYGLVSAESHLEEKKNYWSNYIRQKPFSLKEYNILKRKIAKSREKNLINQFLNDGIPAPNRILEVQPDWHLEKFGDVESREYVAALRDSIRQAIPYYDNFKSCMDFFDNVKNEA